MTKRYVSMGLTAILAVVLIAGFGSAGTVGAQSATAAPTSAVAIKIGLVTDVGHVDDKGFNQSSWEGVQAVGTALGVPTEYLESNSASDYATNINALLNKGDNVIVTVGFNLQQATGDAAKANPNVLFIGVDQDQGTDPTAILPNSVGIVFHEDQSGFLAGVLAARMSKSGKVAGVYGAQVPAVVRFKVGFENGVAYAAKTDSVLSTYYPGDISKAFSDPSWGATTAAQAIDQGADVVFAAAGGTGNGALEETARHTTKDKPLYCIGVDTDQWGTVPNAHPCLISSAEKLIPPALDKVIRSAAAGTLKGGNFYGTVALAPFHDFDSTIPQAVKDELTKLAADLASGALSSGYSAATPAPTMAAGATMAPTASS